MRPHRINALQNFIAGWYLDDESLCDALIAFHNESPNKRDGVMAIGDGVVDKASKDSIDVTLPPSELARAYIEAVTCTAKEYISLYPHSAELVPWGILEPIGIQHYKPGGGFKAWHFERDNSNEAIARRHLAFMTYLNDVEEGGGTEFSYQQVTIQAEKGLTVIFPTEWMFTHRGVVSKTEEKYIVTGWFSTYTKEMYEKYQERRKEE